MKLTRIDLKSPKSRRLLAVWVRAAVQLAFFLTLPSAYTAAFGGVKAIFTQLGAGQFIGWSSFIAAMTMLCGYTLVFGRFFCGYACSFGALGDLCRGVTVTLCKKCGRKPPALPAALCGWLRYAKFVTLTCICALCWAGAYHFTRGWSPWDVFSMLHAGRFDFAGREGGVALLLLIIAGMCIEERFFCRFLCPMGAVFSLLPTLPLFALRRKRENCLRGCAACSRTCPAAVELPDEGMDTTQGECLQCGKCAGLCPRTNIRTGLLNLRGNELWFVLLRAAMLYVLVRYVH